MAEPVGLAASLISLLGTAYTLSKATYRAIDSIRAAPTHIKAISSDIKAMFSVLATLSSYLNDEDNAVGVLHRVVAADLGDVLTNSVSVLKELQILVGEFIKGESSRQNLGRWMRIRLHFKEAEVKQWREQLVAHKITLNVAIALANLVNTSSTEMATKRIEDEVLKLKSMVTSLLIRMNATEELQADREVIMENYRSTIRRVTRGADSIISEAAWDPATSSLSLSVAVSSAGVSEKTEGSYKTARSIANFRPKVVLDETGLCESVDLSCQPPLSDDEASCGRSTGVLEDSKARRGNEMNQIVGKGLSFGPRQLFVKGPNERTHTLTFDCPPTADEILSKIHDRDGVPPTRISLRLGGRVLTDTKTPLYIADGTTLHANVNAIGIGVGPGSGSWDMDASCEEFLHSNWIRRHLANKKKSFTNFWQRDYSDGSFRRSVDWYDERELRRQQQSFAFLVQGLRKIIARGDMIKDDTRSLASGLWSSFSGKRSDKSSS